MATHATTKENVKKAHLPPKKNNNVNTNKSDTGDDTVLNQHKKIMSDNLQEKLDKQKREEKKEKPSYRNYAQIIHSKRQPTEIEPHTVAITNKNTKNL